AGIHFLIEYNYLQVRANVALFRRTLSVTSLETLTDSILCCGFRNRSDLCLIFKLKVMEISNFEGRNGKAKCFLKHCRPQEELKISKVLLASLRKSNQCCIEYLVDVKKKHLKWKRKGRNSQKGTCYDQKMTLITLKLGINFLLKVSKDVCLQNPKTTHLKLIEFSNDDSVNT
ncbi:hypothetical protein Gohar_016714, partial [Gossypium harknessii]|nr:hypothetical protein [Gossypium harknessii]